MGPLFPHEFFFLRLGETGRPHYAPGPETDSWIPFVCQRPVRQSPPKSPPHFLQFLFQCGQPPDVQRIFAFVLDCPAVSLLSRILVVKGGPIPLVFFCFWECLAAPPIFTSTLLEPVFKTSFVQAGFLRRVSICSRCGVDVSSSFSRFKTPTLLMVF